MSTDRLRSLLDEYAELEQPPRRPGDPRRPGRGPPGRAAVRRADPDPQDRGRAGPGRAPTWPPRGSWPARTPASPPRPSELAARIPVIEERLAELLAPRDPNDAKDVILEVKAGEGGEESALFAGDLLRMYLRYAERRGWVTEVLDTQDSDLGGVKDVAVAIKTKGVPEGGYGVWSRLKWEGGVHRVQRVPATESQGRIHTSAAGVLVTPEVEETEVEIDPNDLRIDVFRSSGPGRPVGQHHRLRGAHHPPADRASWSSCQNERSQLQNKDRAMRMLRAKLAAAGRGAGGRGRLGRAQGAGPHGRPVRAHPDLQLPAEPDLRPPDRLHGVQPGPGHRRRPGRRARRADRGRPGRPARRRGSGAALTPGSACGRAAAGCSPDGDTWETASSVRFVTADRVRPRGHE